MLNLAIDRGNTRIKAGLFQDGHLVQQFTAPDFSSLGEQLAGVPLQNAIMSSVSQESAELVQHIPVTGHRILFNAQTPVPVQNQYGTPQTLGADRLAAAVGAQYLLKDRHCLIIDAGTCITYDLLEANGTYQGGSISPGIAMRYQAVHSFTGKLPLLAGFDLPPRPGKTTAEAIKGGVLFGVVAEAEGMIQHYERQYKPLAVILCGGDARFFESTVKARIFVIPELVLIGLNRILEYNV
ncbi:type III pantothenate kinase [Rufibacter glacialis]|uniref:Type III pantothenate kinase n=1 Tax=Rufibacter glacialis TaxID=1259555 RepID=A0A5M8QEA8_9BACT|nr:type III pantothenate kinase [Rufibacter glacialis]KAA6433528.1 type III pantothenate kinase [Rufibacter glacialis]GGK73381.1 type III pantothenate kinase [Rufibacter glacialis]